MQGAACGPAACSPATQLRHGHTGAREALPSPSPSQACPQLPCRNSVALSSAPGPALAKGPSGSPAALSPALAECELQHGRAREKSVKKAGARFSAPPRNNGITAVTAVILETGIKCEQADLRSCTPIGEVTGPCEATHSPTAQPGPVPQPQAGAAGGCHDVPAPLPLGERGTAAQQHPERAAFALPFVCFCQPKAACRAGHGWGSPGPAARCPRPAGAGPALPAALPAEAAPHRSAPRGRRRPRTAGVGPERLPGTRPLPAPSVCSSPRAAVRAAPRRNAPRL